MFCHSFCVYQFHLVVCTCGGECCIKFVSSVVMTRKLCCETGAVANQHDCD